jgi:pilus assembly protein FimV
MLVFLFLAKRRGSAVRELIVKAWFAVLLVVLAPGLANAAGLGRLTVLSALGHPLSAEIELVSVSKAEMGSLSARIAAPEAYRRANLQYNAALPGARVTIEKRPDGRPYLKVTTSRAVTEPFIDLMIELTWSAGRILREYTALLDPPGVGAMPLGQAAPTVSAAPEMRPAPMAPEAPAAPLEPPSPPSPPSPAAQAAPEPPVSAPLSERIAPAPAPTAAAAAAGAKEYGPIERGETLGKIARSVMPEGVSLEQMLLALYRANEDAFIRKNLNLVRAGKILRVPDREEVESISRGEAVTVYRTHVIVWRAYRQRLADAAGKTPASSQSVTRGKIVAKVEDDTSAGSKEVVKISKGEPPAAGAGKAKPRSNVERIRSLEEEVVAREKALAEANERIVQLEKTIKDMQKLMELRSPGMASAQQQAPPTPKVAPVMPEPTRPDMSAPAKPEVAPPAPEKPRVVAKPAPPTPKPKPKVVTPSPAPPQPELMDQVMEALGDPMYLAAGGGVLALGGLAFLMARRRRAREGVDTGLSREGPTLSSAAAAAAGVVASTDDMYSAATPGTTATAGASDDVDPLAEAEVYIAYGRDGQAEEILKEALGRAPNRADVKMKLLEIYTARKDKSAFAELASALQKQIGSSGGDWIKVAAMGYAIDPGNKLYEAGKGAEAPAPSGPRTGQNIDFDLGIGGGAGVTSTDIELDSEAAAAVQAATQTVVDTGIATDVARAQRAADVPKMPDFALDVPPAEPEEADLKLDAGTSARDVGTIDFQIELPPAGTAIHELPTVKDATSPGGVDFKLELPEGGLDLDSKPTPTTVQGVATTKNGHWYDVQTKFDLAKAYQEMGDKAGAKEILQEVINEGDTDQKSQAKALLDSLG